MPEAAAPGGTPGSGGTPEQPAKGTGTEKANGAAGAAAEAEKAGGKPADGQPDGQDGKGDDYAELRASLDKERADRKELAKQLKQLQDKDLPEAERVAREQAETKAENDTLKAELKRLRGQQAVFAEASKLGYADPMDAFRLIELETDDDGNPKNVTAQLTKLLESKPYLKSTTARAATGGSADAGNSNGQPSGGNSMNDLIRAAAGKG
jgi:hypothetical protein